jgi:predicted double-glycine peptidase
LQADVIENLSVQDLRKILESGSPFIVLLDAGVLYHDIAGFGHLVVVIGLERREVVYHDPERGERQRASYSRFWQAWREFDYLGVKIWKHAKK